MHVRGQLHFPQSKSNDHYPSTSAPPGPSGTVESRKLGLMWTQKGHVCNWHQGGLGRSRNYYGTKQDTTTHTPYTYKKCAVATRENVSLQYVPPGPSGITIISTNSCKYRVITMAPTNF